MKPVPGTIQYAIEAYEREMRRARLEKYLKESKGARQTNLQD